MAIIIASTAVFFCWIWIEFFIFFSLLFNKKKNYLKQLSLNKFRWILRVIFLMLFVLVNVYMYIFENEELKNVINLCIGIIK